MAVDEVDRYLAELDEPKRGTLEEMRRRILEVVPDAEQVISYSIPGFRVGGTTIAGLAAFKEHLSYFPHSGSVLAALSDDLQEYEQIKSALHFPVDEPLPRELIERLLLTRMHQAGLADGS